MDSRNYESPRHIRQDYPDLGHWAASRETHMAVACAICAIADSRRTPDQIWEEPTEDEQDHIRMAVAEYIRCGDFEPSEDGRYEWGAGQITVVGRAINDHPPSGPAELRAEIDMAAALKKSEG